jgi:hypothetical protein
MPNTEVKEIWFIHYPKGERPKSIRIGLAADGSADLSPLPEDVRKHLADFGVPDEAHQGKIFASEGPRFLQRLLEETNRYRVFRASPDTV